ncbi:hypothetical protein GCM10010156_34470 [Planobispora rosea]|uniref:Uncharacterized protein n=1 Tax=Planobispora rosea TaxID=35762 RepID=A0A8J3S3J4_PLARO|nr:hypothetical protein GCM10010156_34470 [Planobispora rosea]GIH85311.1 hypothetical protein Pro02_37190 [Planobispora rosea]
MPFNSIPTGLSSSRAEVRCPDCDLVLTESRDRCPRCALPLQGPAAAELWQLDRALAEIREREAGLLARRTELLGILRQERDRPAGISAGARSGTGVGAEFAASGAASGASPGLAASGESRGDISPRAVQNLLLSLGGLLLVVAAVVFTVVSWGSLGIGGRAAVLAGFTAVTLAVPVVLVARGLTATAETVAMLGVALLFLDGYAARRVGLAGFGDVAGDDYAAGLFAVVALAMAGYSRLLPLRLPLPTAIVLAQFPLPLLATDGTVTWFTAALTVTAVADALLLLLLAARNRGAQAPEGAEAPGVSGAERTAGAAPGVQGAAPGARGVTPGARGAAPGVRGVTAVAFGIVWVLGAGCGLLESAVGLLMGFTSDEDWPASLANGALLAVLALTGITVVSRVTAGRLTVLTVASACVLVAGAAAPWLPLVHSAWSMPLYTVAGLAVAAAALYAPGLNGRRMRSAGAVTGGVLAVLTVIPFNDNIIYAYVERFAHLDGIWEGARGYQDEWPVVSVPLLIILALLTAASAAVAVSPAPVRTVEGLRGLRGLLGAAALLSGTLTATLLPAAFTWSHAAELALLLTVAAVLAAGTAAARRPWWVWVLASAAGTVTVLAVVTALAGRTTTHAALVILMLAWGGAASAARIPALRAVAAGTAALLAGGEVLAVGAALGLPPRQAAFGLLAAACLAATAAGLAVRTGLAARTDREMTTGPATADPATTGLWRSRVADAAIGLETAGYVLAAWGLLLATSGAPLIGSGLPSGNPDLPTVSLACAVVGLMLTGTALRPDRRRAAYAGTGFLLLATWARLLASDITVVEAYTVPFSLVLLAFGWWRARAGTTSSWAAYGAALASGLLPSTIAMFSGSGWLRPLLLGTVSLAVLLAGTRLRLQAPAVLGGLTLAAVALHELAPWIARVAVEVPRWVPMALGGLLLVVIGATYEARLREMRRLREAIGRMR